MTDTNYPNWTVHYSGLFKPGFVLLADILHDYAVKAGIPSERITFEGLGGILVRGFMIREDVRWKDVVKAICELYGISFVESDGGWKFRLALTDEDFTPDRLISADDLVEASGGITIKGTRLFEADIPTELEARYVDYQEVKDDNDKVIDHIYTVSSQTAKRPNGVFTITDSKRRESLQVPIILDADIVKRLATQALYRYVSAQDRIRVTLAPKHGDVEPGDVISVPDGDFTRVGKVTAANYKADYTQEITAEDYATEVAVDVDGSRIAYPVPPPPVSPMSQYLHLDLPLLRFDDDRAGAALVQYHVLTGRGQPTWPGARLWRSTTGTDYLQVASKSGVYPVVAAAMNVLGAPVINWTTDRDNSLIVRVTAGDAGEIASCTFADIRAGLNTAAFGAPGRWEIIQWQEVVANADGTLTLSVLHRGRRGTEVYQDQHAAGDILVLLKTAYVDLLAYATGNLRATFYYKAVGTGQFLDDALAAAHQISGAAEKPYAPVHLSAAPTSDSIVLTCTARTRLDGRWPQDDRPFPLGEASLAIQWDIMDGDDVLRTLSSTTETVEYGAAEIAEDFGTIPSSLTFRAYQMSASVGRGHRAEKTVAL